MSHGGAALGDLLSSIQAAARRIANFATYYEMKTRAGVVGSGGVATLLNQVRAAKPDIRLHLVGHGSGDGWSRQLRMASRQIRRRSP